MTVSKHEPSLEKLFGVGVVSGETRQLEGQQHECLIIMTSDIEAFLVEEAILNDS
jgi:hypothetical protein